MKIFIAVKITINEADYEQADLVEYIVNFNNKTRPKNKDDKKKMFLILQKIFIMVESWLLMLLRVDYFH